MTVMEVIQRSSEYLARKGVESPRLQVELMLEKILQMPRLKLYLNFEMALGQEQLDVLREMVRRRGGREPLQHLLGSVSFCGIPLEVGPEVLVPRPETELLAEQAWSRLPQGSTGSDWLGRVLDFGTGSGCLAIAVAKNRPGVEVDAVDISEAALARARTNARLNGVQGRIRFFLGDGFGALPERKAYDLVMSNPPYIASGDCEHLQPEVRDYDPRVALDGGKDGLDFYRRLADEAMDWVRPGGAMLLEIGDGQGAAVQSLLTAAGWAMEAVLHDYSDRERIVIACRSN